MFYNFSNSPNLMAPGKIPLTPLYKSGPDNNIVEDKIKNNSGRESRDGDTITI